MKKKYYIIIFAVLIVIAVIVSLMLLQNRVNKSPELTCETIFENNGEINIVFLSEGLNKDKAIEYTNFFIESEPFVQYKDKFNFYYAGEAKCDIYQNNVLFCYSSDIIKKAASCKDDFIVVLSSRGQLRSSSYGNVISLNVDQNQNVFLHEFAHSFANLADEYVPSELPRGSKNCLSSCNFAIKDGCFQGCSKDSYYRSVESSVMKTLSTSDFGKLNTQIIENVMEKY